MKEYKNSDELIAEIQKRANLFISEFENIPNDKKNMLIDGVDKTPTQMISYQLGWMRLIQKWEQENQNGNEVITPSPDYKWNNLGGLYKSFYDEYKDKSLEELVILFKQDVDQMINLVSGYSHEELFSKNQRQWAYSTPSNWEIWKWIHINTVAPFTNFRTKIRKWKRNDQADIH